MNQISIKEDFELHYGDLFKDQGGVYLVTNPDTPKMVAALIEMESGTSIVTGTLSDLKTFILQNKLAKLPIGSTITLTVK
jgi:hypothetical protein